MSDELHDDIKQILEKTTRIEAALWPDPNQPGVLTRHTERIDKLEGWRNFLAGAWFVVTFVATTVFGIHIHGGNK